MVLIDITLNLMLHNMTHRKFHPVLQKDLLFILIPLLMILGFGLEGQIEQLIVQVATVMAFFNFIIKMAIISK